MFKRLKTLRMAKKYGRAAVYILTGILLAVSFAGCGKKAEDQQMQTLKVGNIGNGIKAAMVVLAHEMGYYEEEGVKVEFEQIANLNDGLTAIETGKMDVLPMGIIPTVTFASKGGDYVLFGGTIAEGGEIVADEKFKDKVASLEDLEGLTIACVRPETSHMIVESMMRDAGLDVEETTQFVEMDGFQNVIEAVKKGTADVGFVNSGFGLIAKQQGLSVVLQIGDLMPDAVCCRQTTSQKVIDSNRDALVKFEIANLRAYLLSQDDHDTAIEKLTAYSGQDEEYVDYCLYGDAMKITLDPAKNKIEAFYGVMQNNGDIPEDSKWDADKNVDTSIYKEALDELMKREPDNQILKNLLDEFQANNE